MSTNLFEIASRNKLRFTYPNTGSFSDEELWDIPLTASPKSRRNNHDGLDSFPPLSLDNLAKYLHRRLKDSEEVSFVNEGKNSPNSLLQLQLDIVKHVIAVKIKERDKEIERKRILQTNETISEIIRKKEMEELENMPLDDLKKLIANNSPSEGEDGKS